VFSVIELLLCPYHIERVQDRVLAYRLISVKFAQSDSVGQLLRRSAHSCHKLANRSPRPVEMTISISSCCYFCTQCAAHTCLVSSTKNGERCSRKGLGCLINADLCTPLSVSRFVVCMCAEQCRTKCSACMRECSLGLILAHFGLLVV